MEKQWLLAPKHTQEQENKLFQELISYAKEPDTIIKSAYQIFSKLLLQREISTIPQAIAFNKLEMDQLHDPFLMRNMQKAVHRISTAIEADQKIMVYGDYDVDGTTSVALMTSFLKPICKNLIYYIPDRYTEGYGVSFQGIDTASKEKVNLIIALDCGIKAVDKVIYAKEKGIDFIICDHHTPGDIIPDAIAVLDPKQSDCDYPYKELPGCGIGFKLCQALQKQLNTKYNLESLLDLVAISIACDIVPVTGENRVLAAIGLHIINNTPRASIKALLGEVAPNSKVRISNLVFQIGPKINAAGRISSGKTAVDMLLSEEQSEVIRYAVKINTYNEERKEKDKTITEEAIAKIANDPSLIKKNSTVLFDPNWHKGVVGIVASRVIEKYYKPTIILTQSSNGIIGGSVRSVRGFDVYQALEKCSEYMLQFGGHKYAAGLTLKPEQLPGFIEKFEAVVSAQMTEEKFLPTLNYDSVISIDDVNFKLMGLIDKLEPFGPQNMTPTFVITNVVDTGRSRAVGTDKAHLKLDITDPNTGLIVPAIAFGLGHLEPRVQSGEYIDVIFTIDINYWNNKEILQLMVKDIRFKDKQ